MQNISQPSINSAFYTRNQADNTLFSDVLDLSHVFYKLLSPATAVLMDTCQLSYSQVRFALAPVCQLITYQLLVIHAKGGVEKALNSELVTQLLNLSEWKHGFNFQTVKVVEPFVTSVCQTVFTDTVAYAQSKGLLLAYTPLSLAQLEHFIPWCTLLCLYALATMIKRQAHSLDTFLAWQPILLANAPLSKVFAQVTGYHDSMSQQIRLTELKHINRAPDAHQQAWADLITQYLAQKPFAIAVAPSKPPKILSTAPITPTQKPPTDIFAKHTVTPRKKWLDTLQKYWIATATATSVVVFGGLGLLQHNSPTNKPPQASNNATPSEKHYNDVAIVRVASQPEPIATASTPNEPKNRPAQASSPTSIKNKDSVKTAKNPEQVTDKTTKKSTSQKTDEKKSGENKASKKLNPISDTDKTATNKKVDKKPLDKSSDKKNTDKKSTSKKTTDTNTAQTNDKASNKVSDKKATKTIKKSTSDTNDKKTRDKSNDKNTDKS